MSKLKTSKSIYKRFKVTSTLKLLCRRASRNHLLQKKKSKRKQDLRQTFILNSKDKLNLKNKLPYMY